jgi:tRNA-specific 2-thiouridylase
MPSVELTGDSARDDAYAFVRLLLEDGRIVHAEAAGLDRPLEGLTLLEAAAVPGETLAADALANAIGPAFEAGPSHARIAVAMSGGVDSAVALLHAAPDAIGVTLRLWLDPAGPSAERACCSPEAVIAARETCHRLGLPHVTLDLRDRFRADVVQPFVDGYAAGTTPNPCMRCNGSFRFDTLVAFAERAGCTVLWTGHYARVVERDGRRLLARAADPAKDQSYMLATVDPGLLDRIGFPLGEHGKDVTRAEAAAAGLAVAERPDSQEACFLAGGDYRDFLERHGLEPRPGAIVDEGGRELARHAGTWRFTPGQRRGIGVSAPEPLYAIRTDAATNTVVVGPRAALEVREIEVEGRMYVPVGRADAKLRHRSPATPASVESTGSGMTVVLDEPAFGVALGQVAVLYDGDAVVGAGVIVAAKG